MTKTFKKSLAVVVAIAMCLTAVVGALTVSATDGNTITVNSTTATEGATSSTVTISVVSTGFAAQLFTITYDTTLGTPTASINDASGAKLTVNSATAGTIVCLVENNSDNTVANVTAATITLAFASTTGYPVGSYSVAVSNVSAADSDESLVTFNDPTNGAVTVSAASYEDATLKLSGASLTLANGFAINFIALPATLNGWTDPYVVFKKALYDVSGTVTGYSETTVPYSATTSDSTNVYYTLSGIFPQEIGSEITATIYGTKDGHVYTGGTVTYSVLKFATNNLKKSTTTAAMKTALADMLYYGNATQTYASYNTANMIVDAATAAIGDSTWQSNATSTLRTLTSVKANQALTGATMKIKSAALTLQDKVVMQFGVSDASGAALTDYSNYYVHVTYTDGYNTTKTYDLAIDNTSSTASLDKLISTEMSIPVTAVIMDRTTGAAVSNTVTYSIESFAYAKANDASLGSLVASLIKYGDAVRAYAGL